ncbi:hypothetical protein ISCGN_001996 [Ixodes scapularis]
MEEILDKDYFIDEEILSAFHRRHRGKVETLLAAIFSVIAYTPEGTLVVHGEPLEGSNIVDLVHYELYNRQPPWMRGAVSSLINCHLDLSAFRARHYRPTKRLACDMLTPMVITQTITKEPMMNARRDLTPARVTAIMTLEPKGAPPWRPVTSTAPPVSEIHQGQRDQVPDLVVAGTEKQGVQNPVQGTQTPVLGWIPTDRHPPCHLEVEQCALLQRTPVYEKQGPKWCIASPGGPRRVQTYPGLGSTTRMPFSPDTGKPRTARRGRANPHGSGSVETPLSKHLLSQILGTTLELGFHHAQKKTKYSVPDLFAQNRGDRVWSMAVSTITLNFRGDLPPPGPSCGKPQLRGV